jgi:hypothetical protein
MIIRVRLDYLDQVGICTLTAVPDTWGYRYERILVNKVGL